MSRNNGQPVSPWRFRLVCACLLLGLGAVIGRAAQLQIVESDELRKAGRARFQRHVVVPAHRGRILDRHGEPIAVSAPVDAIWAEPRQVLAHRSSIQPLAQLLERAPQDLERFLQERANRGFVYLRRHMRPDQAARVMALGIEGVSRQREYRRYYPTAEVTGQLIGYTNIDNQGQEGLELGFEEWLVGRPGTKRVVRDGHGRIIDVGDYLRAPEPGRDLRLSIDRRVQYMAYRVLKTSVLQHRAKAGSAVVLDVTTGEILAMVNQPAANPNDRSRLSPASQRNRAIVDLFEPGSTVKPFTVAAALEAKRCSPNTPVDTRPGYLRVGRHVVRDVRDFGVLDVAGVIRKSSNVGISKLALALPETSLWSLYRRLGFGEPTGVEFPGEVPGELRHYSDWTRFERATHSFGYGLSVNVLQLADAYVVLAADGVRRTPTIVARDEVPAGERVMSPQVAATVRRLMEAVVADGGTAPRAQVAGYRVAGKTGTVKKSARGGYEDDRFLALFAGMAPASRPKLVVVVMIDDPRGEQYYGGQVAAPAFSRILSGALRLMDVPPDDIPSPRTVVAHAAKDGRK